MTSTIRFDRWEDSAGNAVADVATGSLFRRNLLYNGAMQVAQRGTSSTGITSSGYYTADRWQIGLSSMGTWTNTIEADGPSGTGFTKSFKMLCTTADSSPAASDLIIFQQALEGQDLQGLKKGTADAESLTLSFWVKSNVTGTYIVRFSDEDNGRYISQSYTVTSSGVWEKKIITIPGDTSGVISNDNNRSLNLQWWLGAGNDYKSGSLGTSWGADVAANFAVGQVNVAANTNNYWQVTGVQLETGTVATEFEFKSYGTELAECQRYYQVDSNAQFFGGYGTSPGGAAFLQRPFVVTMRSAPTVTMGSGSEGSSFSVALTTQDGFIALCTPSNTAAPRIANFTANAEL